MANNLAGSCRVGFILNKIDSDCQGFSKIAAYACEIGQIAGAPNTRSLKFSNFILADNKRGGTLKFGGVLNYLNHTGFF